MGGLLIISMMSPFCRPKKQESHLAFWQIFKQTHLFGFPCTWDGQHTLVFKRLTTALAKMSDYACFTHGRKGNQVTCLRPQSKSTKEPGMDPDCPDSQTCWHLCRASVLFGTKVSMLANIWNWCKAEHAHCIWEQFHIRTPEQRKPMQKEPTKLLFLMCSWPLQRNGDTAAFAHLKRLPYIHPL